MTLARIAAATMNSLVTVAKRYALDTSMTAPKWSESEYLLAMNFVAVEMQVRARGRSGHAQIGTADLTYTADAESVALLSGTNYESLYKVSDVTDENRPSDILWGPVNELHASRVITSKGVVAARRRWTLLAGTSTPFYPRIAIWPIPTAEVDLKLYFFVAPIGGEGGDNFFLAPEWQELVAMGAARRLRGLHGEEWGPVAEKQYQELLALFEEMNAFHGLKTKPRRRQW